MKSAAVLPWLGSVKHSWKTLSWPSVTVVEEAEGVSWKTLSLKLSAATAAQEPEVVQP